MKENKWISAEIFEETQEAILHLMSIKSIRGSTNKNSPSLTAGEETEL
jgi:hypothetical protein